MKLLIFRHAESEKNKSKSFASAANKEVLTEAGQKQVDDFAQSIRKYVADNGLRVKKYLRCRFCPR